MELPLFEFVLFRVSPQYSDWALAFGIASKAVLNTDIRPARMISRLILCSITQKKIWASRGSNLHKRRVNQQTTRTMWHQQVARIYSQLYISVMLKTIYTDLLTAAHIHSSDVHVTTCRQLATGRNVWLGSKGCLVAGIQSAISLALLALFSPLTALLFQIHQSEVCTSYSHSHNSRT